MTLPTSRNGKITLAIVLVVVVFLASIAGAVMHRQPGSAAARSGSLENRKTEEGVPETFMDVPRHWKNDTYKEYLKEFFSNGDTATSVMFNPSIVDIACVTMTERVTSNVDCSTAPLDSISTADTRVIALPGHEKCSSLAVAKQPLDHSDAEVRILNGIYHFHKTCITTPYISINEISGSRMRLVLSSESPAALYIKLNRPVFVMTDTSFLYRVMYNNGDKAALYRGGDPGGNRFPDSDDTVELLLEQVRDTRVWDAESYGRRLRDLFPARDSFMPLTMYYLRYVTPVRIGISNVTYGQQNAVTLVFRMSTDAVRKDTWLSTEGLSVPGFSVGMSGRSQRGRSEAEVWFGGQNRGGTDGKYVSVANRGYLVVVYSNNLLVLCYMSRSRCHLVRYGNVPKLTIDNVEGFQSAVDAAGAAVPALCFPNITFGIPNLYDMYTRLVAFV